MATAPAIFGADQFLVTVTFDDIPNPVQFSMRSGGEFDSSTVQSYPGGMLPARVRPGQKTVGDLTLSKDFEFGDAGIMSVLATKVGKGGATCTSQPLDADGHAYGRGFVWTGLLKGLTTPEHDATSPDSNARWTVVLTPTTTLGSVNT